MIVKYKNKIKIIFLWIVIFLYPFLSSFFGIDMGDTGIHYINYKYVYQDTYIAGYSTVFTSIIGNMWWHMWGFLGVWCLNFLEVLIEWCISVVIYRWLSRYMDRTCVTIGILLSVIACDCYLNIFNYHQFTVLLIILYMLLLFRAVMNDKKIYSFLAGVVYLVSIFARFSSLPIILLFLIIILDDKFLIKDKLIHMFWFVVGGICSGSAIICYLFQREILSAWFTSLFKMNEMANSVQSSYSIGNILHRLLWDNIATLASPLIMVGSGILLACSIFLFFESKDSILIRILLMITLFIISACLCIYAYDVNPVDNSPQFTTGYNVMFGVCFFNAICSMLKYLYKDNKELLYISIFSILLPVFVTFASNTGTKHIIISMWIFIPLMIDNIRKIYLDCKRQKRYLQNVSIIVGIYILSFAVFKYCHMIYSTNNFDSLKRMSICENIESRNFRYLYTTKREQQALDGLYEYYKELSENNQRMLVFGAGFGIYPLLDVEPFARANIIDKTYSCAQFENDLNKTQNKGFPIIIYCKTNQYFGYGSSNYQYLIELEKRNSYYGKKEMLYEFIDKNQYSIKYENDYYIVYNNANEK